MSYEMFMSEALIEAEKARDDGDWAIGCVVALGNEIIARGRNRVNSSRNRMAHAEIEALDAIQDDHFDHIENKNMVMVSTFEPCPMCFGATVLNGIRTIVSGINIDRSGASSMLGNLPPHFLQPRYETTITTGVLAKECADMWASGRAAKAMLATRQGFASDISAIGKDYPVITYSKNSPLITEEK